MTSVEEWAEFLYETFREIQARSGIVMEPWSRATQAEKAAYRELLRRIFKRLNIVAGE